MAVKRITRQTLLRILYAERDHLNAQLQNYAGEATKGAVELQIKTVQHIIDLVDIFFL